MDGLATEDPAKNTTEDPAKNTTDDQAVASSSTLAVPKAKPAPFQADLDAWAKLPFDEKLRLMREAQARPLWSSETAVGNRCSRFTGRGAMLMLMQTLC